jgi:putative Mg2+ transporter-C (MgtC) family protein
LPELGWVEIVLRVVLAAGLGGAIGLERELREREAGLRTHMLVSVGAALFTLVSAYAWTDWRFSNAEGLVFDPTRIAAQVVSGIGFLGAGAIIRQGLSIRGLTTAATLWVVAAIGMAAGVGYYEAAVVTTALVLLSLWPLRILAYRVSTRFRPEEGRLAVELPAGAMASSVLAAVESTGAHVSSLEFEEEGDRRRVDLHVRLGAERTAAELIDALTQAEEIRGARWNP